MYKLTKHSLLLALAGALLASCAGLIGPRDLEIPLSKMQSGLDRRFPLHNRALELFEIELSRPQLSMQPDAGRIAMTMDALVAPPFTRKTWHGTLMLSGRLVIDPLRSAVLMADPRVDSFTVDGVDEARQRNLAQAASLLMHHVVDDVPLYHFRPEDLRYGGVQFVPTRIATTARGLLVSVEPAH
ncbi:MAG: DUF1439 domain-containing protein [Pseudomonadota bacterium]